MKVTTNLNPESVKGYCNGTLYMKISAQTDWRDDTGWQVGSSLGSDLNATLTVKPNISIALQITPITEGVAGLGTLRLKGTATVSVGGVVVASTMGPLDSEKNLTLIPSQTAATAKVLSAAWVSDNSSKIRFGYWLNVNWDGQGAECHGLWWFNW